MTDQQADDFLVVLAITTFLCLAMGAVLGCQWVRRRRIRDKVVASFVGSGLIPLLLGGTVYLAFRLCLPTTGNNVILGYSTFAFCGGAVGGGFGAMYGHFLLTPLGQRLAGMPRPPLGQDLVAMPRPLRGRRPAAPVSPMPPPQTVDETRPGQHRITVGTVPARDRVAYKRGSLIAFIYFLFVFYQVVSNMGTPGFDLTRMPWWERLALAFAPSVGPVLLSCLVRRRWPDLGRGILDEWAPKGWMWLIIYGLGNMVVSLSGYR